jgi:hypothetical protein
MLMNAEEGRGSDREGESLGMLDVAGETQVYICCHRKASLALEGE